MNKFNKDFCYFWESYVDVGSSIDEFVQGYKTRPYMNPYSEYSKAISFFLK